MNSGLEQLSDAVRLAGNRALNFFHSGDYTTRQKSFNNPVTQADLEVNDIISRALQEIFPEDIILSEETYEADKKEIDRRRKTGRRIWFLDPIDGTKEFINGVPEFAISLGLFENGEPSFGFIHNPAADFLMTGGSDQELLVNGKVFVPSPPKTLLPFLSRSEMKKNLFSDVEKKIPLTEKNIVGSIAYKLGLLAADRCNLVVSRRPKNDWDIIGGLALLRARKFSYLTDKGEPLVLNSPSMKLPGLLCGSESSLAVWSQLTARK